MITTHVLDTSRGTPGRDIAIELEHQHAGAWHAIGAGRTDSDGRLRALTQATAPLATGTYRMRFHTAAYFAALEIATFYPLVEIHFDVHDAAAHFHVPLLISPFGYSTYRGS